MVKSRFHLKITEQAMELNNTNLETELKQKFGSGKRFYWCMSYPNHCTLEELLLLSDALKDSPINLYQTHNVGKDNITQREYQLLREYEQLKAELLTEAMPMGAV